MTPARATCLRKRFSALSKDSLSPTLISVIVLPPSHVARVPERQAWGYYNAIVFILQELPI